MAHADRKQTYGFRKGDDDISLIRKIAFVNHPQNRLGNKRRAHGNVVLAAKREIRTVGPDRAVVADLMVQFGLTEGKIRTLIAKVRKELSA